MVSLGNSIRRFFAAKPKSVKDPYQSSGGGADPFARLYSGNQRFYETQEYEQRRTQLLKYRHIYDEGGTVSQAIDLYPLYIFSNGWHVEGPTESIAEGLEEELGRIGFDDFAFRAALDSMIYGRCYQEIVPTRGGGVFSVVPRAPYMWGIETDDYNHVAKFINYVPISQGNYRTIAIEPQNIISFSLLPSQNKYGASLIGRAYDEIVRDAKTAESTTEALVRHGFRKWDVSYKTPETPLTEDEMDDEFSIAENKLRDLNAKSEFFHTDQIEVKQIDAGPLGNVAEVNRTSLDRTLSALGAPGELLGVAWGSTEATAKVKLESFYNRIESMQRRMAAAYTSQLLNRMVERQEYKLVFNEVNPRSATETATWISNILKATPLDPYETLTVGEVRQALGYTAKKPEGE